MQSGATTSTNRISIPPEFLLNCKKLPVHLRGDHMEGCGFRAGGKIQRMGPHGIMILPISLIDKISEH